MIRALQGQQATTTLLLHTFDKSNWGKSDPDPVLLSVPNFDTKFKTLWGV